MRVPTSSGPAVLRRLAALNRNGVLLKTLEYSQVKASLNILGDELALQVLQELEDEAANVPDPVAYIKEVSARVAASHVLEPATERGGVARKRKAAQCDVDDGTSMDMGGDPAPREGGAIAKRIRLMNKSGKLATPINYRQVKEALASVGVGQAMTILMGLADVAPQVCDPTGYIRTAVRGAGGTVVENDDIEQEAVEEADTINGTLEMDGYELGENDEDDANGMTVPASKEKTLDAQSKVIQQLTTLNDSGALGGQIDVAEIAEDLAKVGEVAAMQLLQEVEDKGASVKNPTAYMKFKLKAKLASMESTLEETADDITRVVKHIEWLNDYGCLARDIDYQAISRALRAVGPARAMAVLKELEENKADVQDPNSFILNAVQGPGRQKVAQKVEQKVAQKKTEAEETPAGTTDLATIASFMGFLSRSSKLKQRLRFSEVASALDALGPKKALAVLQEMQERGLGMDDPVTYIRAAAHRSGVDSSLDSKTKPSFEDSDDAATLSRRLRMLNKSKVMHQKINVEEVVGPLYCIGLPRAMAILRDLHDRGDRIPDPTKFIKLAIQRANRWRQQVQDDEEEEPAVDDGELVANEEDGLEDSWEAEETEEEEAEADEVEEDAEPEGEEEEVAVEADDYGGAGADPAEEPDDGEEVEPETEAAEKLSAKRLLSKPAEPTKGKTRPLGAEKRVVGGLTGYSKLVPTRAQEDAKTGKEGQAAKLLQMKQELNEELQAAGAEEMEEEKPAEDKSAEPEGEKKRFWAMTPQEKLVKVKTLAEKHKLDLDQACLKRLSRLPYYKVKDLIIETVLGGKNRQGVQNPSRYLTIGAEKETKGLGVEQGIAMEFAVTLGLCLSLDCLDELACVPRARSKEIMRRVADIEEAAQDPFAYIAEEVLKVRAEMDARPWGAPS